MPKTFHCAAVDLGATSGRVIVGTWSNKELTLSEVHRFANGFQSLGKHDYWNLPGLWAEVQAGLRKAAERFPKLASVGVDTWGVDHVLLNKEGRLVFPAHAYRDGRTQPGLARMEKSPVEMKRVYDATGIPNVFYNSSLQLAEVVKSCPEVKSLAKRCLLLPDYFNYLLSGRMENELSIASTTQLLDVNSADWSRKTLEHFGIPAAWFSKPISAGTELGRVVSIPELAKTRVIAVPGHDTASAYDAMPADPEGGDLFLSSGTWSLIGFESKLPVLGEAALASRISNERMGDGRYRPLTNVIGLWLLEGAIKDFASRPKSDAEWSALVAAAEALPLPKTLLDVSDPAFSNPSSMRAVIDAQLRRKKSAPPKDLAGYMRLICESLGRGHAEAMRNFERLANRRFKRILMVGGGSKNRLLCQATANATGLQVVSFALEGTAVGNIASQLVALGAVRNLAAFRAALGDKLEKTVYLSRLQG